MLKRIVCLTLVAAVLLSSGVFIQSVLQLPGAGSTGGAALAAMTGPETYKYHGTHQWAWRYAQAFSGKYDKYGKLYYTYKVWYCSICGTIQSMTVVEAFYTH
ncbi:hypothetical protein AGMMS49992_33500 [Clostridia bacterium]|nr:hypothetical protein AGMMS49992_33500 [Clostridia bacterium]